MKSLQRLRLSLGKNSHTLEVQERLGQIHLVTLQSDLTKQVPQDNTHTGKPAFFLVLSTAVGTMPSVH
jgi:hypothetical protein